MPTEIKKPVNALCPGCDNEIYLDHTPKLGEFVTCSECGDLVEVVSLSPLILDWSADTDDDWSEDWEDDGEEYLDDEEYMDDFDYDE